MKKFIHVVFEKYGMLKLFGSAILALFFFWLFDRTGLKIFKMAIIPPAVYFAVTALILFSYAWIINPIKSIKEKNKK